MVTGALSPQTRNAQVEIYQNGDVGFIAATDAVGMGLNLDVDTVCFSDIRKFDGRRFRFLHAQEAAQIAGRAGRYMKDGAFCFNESFPLDDPFLIDKIENHRFEDVTAMFWRNPAPDFSSPHNLIASLAEKPDTPFLKRARKGEDIEVFQHLVEDKHIRNRVTEESALRLLWETAQIPDYGKLHIFEHAALLKSVFLEYCREDGKLSEDFIKKRIKACENVSEDIEDLTKKIARIRTWTYICQKSDRVKNAEYWRQKTRALENDLSDALHEALKKRFVNKKTHILLKERMADKEIILRIDENGAVNAEGENFGTVRGFKFYPEKPADEGEAEAAKTSLDALISKELEKRTELLIEEGDAALRFGDAFGIYYRGEIVARLNKSEDFFKPELALETDERLEGVPLARLALHIQSWLQRQIKPAADLFEAVRNNEELQGAARGVAFRLIEELGYAPRKVLDADLKTLSQEDRSKLRKAGVRFAQYGVFLRDVFKPAVQKIKLILKALQDGEEKLPPAPPVGLVSFPRDPELPDSYYRIAGYNLCGDIAVRADMIEKLADAVRPLALRGPENPKGEFEVTPAMMSFVGKSGEEFDKILSSLGYSHRVETVKVISVKPAAPTETPPSEAEKPTEETPAEPDVSTDEAAAAEASEPAKQEPAEPAEPSDDTKASAAPSADMIETEIEKKIWFWAPKPKKEFRKPDGASKGKFERGANAPAGGEGEKAGGKYKPRRDYGDKHSEDGGRAKSDTRREGGKKFDRGGKNRRDGRDNRDRDGGKDKKKQEGDYLSHVGKFRIEGDENPFSVLMNLKDKL